MNANKGGMVLFGEMIHWFAEHKSESGPVPRTIKPFRTAARQNVMYRAN
jgi:hypothetical protein